MEGEVESSFSLLARREKGIEEAETSNYFRALHLGLRYVLERVRCDRSTDVAYVHDAA
jgi:hypothetical protein